MKKNFRFMAMAVVAMAATVFTGCSSDDDFLIPYEESAIQTRATPNPDGTTTITFDDFASSMMAMTTSYGANYYGNVGSYTQVKEIADPDGVFMSEINTVTNNYGTFNNFSCGGLALSKWNYRTNPSSAEGITITGDTIPSDWWYSYNNQMSVYDTTSVNGSNEGAGHSGNNFAVVYGYSDEYNTEWMAQPEFYLTGEYTLKGLWFCNSSYTYGVIMHGNKFGASGVATPLSAQVDAGGNHIGYFQVELECYDFAGNKLATYTKVLADYRNGKNENPVTTWTYWPINQAGVGFVKFNFSGSDTGEYGLNTPAYLCIDDIVFEN